MSETIVSFDSEIQKELIQAVTNAAPHQRVEIYYIASDATHLHILAGWRHNKQGKIVRSQLKWSLSHSLNTKFEPRKWLVEKGSGQQVKNRQHFNHLRNVYLPKHNGWKWSPDRGFFR